MNRFDRPEHAIAVIVGSGGEEELVRRAVGAAAFAEIKPPKLIDDDWLAGRIGKSAEEFAFRWAREPADSSRKKAGARNDTRSESRRWRNGTSSLESASLSKVLRRREPAPLSPPLLAPNAALSTLNSVLSTLNAVLSTPYPMVACIKNAMPVREEKQIPRAKSALGMTGHCVIYAVFYNANPRILALSGGQPASRLLASELRMRQWRLREGGAMKMKSLLAVISIAALAPCAWAAAPQTQAATTSSGAHGSAQSALAGKQASAAIASGTQVSAKQATNQVAVGPVRNAGGAVGTSANSSATASHSAGHAGGLGNLQAATSGSGSNQTGVNSVFSTPKGKLQLQSGTQLQLQVVGGAQAHSPAPR